MEIVLAAVAGLSLGLTFIVLLILFGIQSRVQRLDEIDAKLDVLLKQQGLAPPPAQPAAPTVLEAFSPANDVTQEIQDALARGDKLEAVRLYKISSGVSLMEAKRFIEEVQRRQSLPKT